MSETWKIDIEAVFLHLVDQRCMLSLVTILIEVIKIVLHNNFFDFWFNVEYVHFFRPCMSLTFYSIKPPLQSRFHQTFVVLD